MHDFHSFAIPFTPIMILLGASMGSFLNCLAWRTAHEEPIWKGRSHCETCRHTLAPRDLIPIFSYLAAHGRCRYCGAKIPRETLISELAGALACAALTIKFGFTKEWIMWLIFTSHLHFLSLTDYLQYIIPDTVLASAIVNRLIFLIISRDPLTRLPVLAVSALSVSLPMLLLALLMDRIQGEETMGGGDIKLFFVLGFYLNWKQMLLTLLTACLLGTAGGLLQKRKLKREHIPFAPYITASVLLILLFGQPALDWYAAVLGQYSTFQ